MDSLEGDFALGAEGQAPETVKPGTAKLQQDLSGRFGIHSLLPVISSVGG